MSNIVLKVFDTILYLLKNCKEREGIMFKYVSNHQVKKEFKKAVIDHDTTMVAIAQKCGINRQQLNNRFNNNRLAFSDLSKWCDAMDCDLIIDFKPRKAKPQEEDY